MVNSTNIAFLLVAAGGICIFWLLLRAASEVLRGVPGQDAAENSNRRSLRRFRAKYHANIQVLDDHSQMIEGARIINLSEYGAQVRLQAELPAGTFVRLRIPRMHLAAAGHVRSCAKTWFGYQVGLEFRGTLYKTSF